MRRIFSLVFTFLLFQGMTASGTYAQGLQFYNCPELPSISGEMPDHKRLFKYAVLAEFVYGDISGTPLHLRKDLHEYCPQGIEKKERILEGRISQIPARIYEKAKAKTLQKDDSVKVAFTNRNDEKFITCTRKNTLGERIAVAFRYVTDDRSRGASLLVRIGIIGEELKILEIRGADGRKILGVQGTDSDRISQWNASIRQLMADSCIFDFSVEVTKVFFDPWSDIVEPGRDINAIVGHSLGGAVAQHVILHRDIKMFMKRKGLKLQAYSFNSIGVDSLAKNEANLNEANLTSVRIAGEILEQIGEGLLGRKQLGHIYRYGGVSPPDLSFKERWQRHGIKKVKEEICRCLSDNHLEYQYGYR